MTTGFVIVAVSMVVIVIVMMVVRMAVRVAQTLGAFVEHQAANPDDRQAGDRAQHGEDPFGQHILGKKQGGQPEQENADGMGEGHHAAEENSLFESAARSDQISRDDGFAVAGGERVHGSQSEGYGHAEQNQTDSEVTAMQEAGEKIAANDRAGGGGLRRHGCGGRSGCREGLDFRPECDRRGGGNCRPCDGCAEILRRGDGRVDGIGGQRLAAVGISLGGAFDGSARRRGDYDLFPPGAIGKIAIFVSQRSGGHGELEMRGDAQDGGAAGTGCDGELGIFESGEDSAAAGSDLEVTHTLARLIGGFAIEVDAGAIGGQAPLLQQLKTGDFGEIEDVLDPRASGRDLDARIMVHTEVAHGVGGQGGGQREKERPGARFHYNRSLRILRRFGFMHWVTSEDVPRTGELRVPAGAIFTPSARELAEARAIRIIETRAGEAAPAAAPDKIVALGADHGGFRLKETLKPVLTGLGLELRDVGVNDEKPADYPDIAVKVAELVARGEARRGVIIDGAGIGSSIAANKVAGIRAALCYDRASARNSREHNDSNVLTLGARLLTASQAEEVLRTWLETPFAGGRHAARVEKISKIEQQYGRPAEPVAAAEQPKARVDGPVASLIDHTMLRPEATRADIVKLCGEARQYGFATVCINPYWVPLAASELAGSKVKVCTVAGFPLGATSTEAKVAETAAALRAGAREIDMVINIGALRSGDLDTVKMDIAAVAKACHDAGAILKVILETALLDDAQKKTACSLAQGAGADFVKTSTGFGPAGATVQDVVLMRHAVGPRMGVKAAGGIRTLDDFRAMVAAGANRVGASASVKIVEAAGK